jgi:hypothetical protein
MGLMTFRRLRERIAATASESIDEAVAQRKQQSVVSEDDPPRRSRRLAPAPTEN